MKHAIALTILLIAFHAEAAERGGESPEAVAQRYQQAIANGNIAEIAACLHDNSRGVLLLLNLKAALEISRVLDGLDESYIRSPDFSIDDLPQDTDQRRSFVAIAKRNGMILGGPPTLDRAEDAFSHILWVAGPNPDRTIAELDAYNRSHLGTANPTDLFLGMAPSPEFSEFSATDTGGTVRMGDTRVNVVRKQGRWYLSDVVAIRVESGSGP